MASIVHFLSLQSIARKELIQIQNIAKVSTQRNVEWLMERETDARMCVNQVDHNENDYRCSKKLRLTYVISI